MRYGLWCDTALWCDTVLAANDGVSVKTEFAAVEWPFTGVVRFEWYSHMCDTVQCGRGSGAATKKMVICEDWRISQCAPKRSDM